MQATKIKKELGVVENLDIHPRYFLQTAERAMKNDIIRALVELTTNADDTYNTIEEAGMEPKGEIHFEIERRKNGKTTTIRVRDFGEGMGLEEMVRKLKRVGKVTSKFIERKGRKSRGLMGRGSRECVIFGNMKYQTIKGEMYSEVHLFKTGQFKPVAERKVNEADRIELGINYGNGTLVSIEVEPQFKIPNNQTIINDFPRYYSLRDIASNPSRTLLLSDMKKSNKEPSPLVYTPRVGTVEVDEKFTIPGYPNAEVHLLIKKSDNRVEFENSAYWEGGILIQSNYAIHANTLFSRNIENDPHAEFYFGRLICPYIDELLIDYEKIEDEQKRHPEINPSRIIDPLRSDGLVREHPFTKVLYEEAEKRLKALLERDRSAERQEKQAIENEKTKERMQKLAKEARKFIQDNIESSEDDDDFYLDPAKVPSGGMVVIPGGVKVPLGGERKFYIYVRPGQGRVDKHVMVSTDSETIHATTGIRRFIERDDGIWFSPVTVKGLGISDDAKIKVTWARTTKYIRCSVIEEQEALELAQDFAFEKDIYNVREGKQKTLRVLAKFPDFLRSDVTVQVELTGDSVKLVTERIRIKYDSKAKVMIGNVKVLGEKIGASSTLTIKISGNEASTKVKVIPSKEFGKDLEINVVDEDFGEQRAIWENFVIKIAGRHPTLQRYLGPSPNFSGQDSLLFRMLIAELIADTVARRIFELDSQSNSEKYEDMDISGFYRHHRKLANKFLDIAHKIQVPENELLHLAKDIPENQNAKPVE